VSDIFNTRSFINATDYFPQKNQQVIKKIGKLGQMDFEDILPRYLKGPKIRIKRKLKSLVRDFKIKLQFSGMDFSPLIEQIIALDTQPELYLECLRQPWFNNNTIPENTSSKKRWIEIFNSR
jgi:hypothetical protein